MSRKHWVGVTDAQLLKGSGLGTLEKGPQRWSRILEERNSHTVPTSTISTTRHS
jgi:hypothetical protein